MKMLTRIILLFILTIEGEAMLHGEVVSTPTRDQLLNTMKKAARYMVNQVSIHGGYRWTYSEDLSESDGEAPGRESQIMVYGGTTTMGHLFLDMHEVTGDSEYLDYAQKAADALIYGQHAAGGWHYLIDFEMNGLDEWYTTVASKCIYGMEEYRHYYGNCTFDDNTTQGATTFLLRVYMATLNPKYLYPLQKALEFILEAQYPNGGWPQRYPLRYDHGYDKLPDYTSMYTLNDNAMSSTITLLLNAYEKLGDIRYLEAAKRGGDFFMIVQGPEGQAAWAEQYDMNLQPCWARTHEYPGYMIRQTINTMYSLAELYLFTGDKRYLRPIPAAIEWLEASKLKIDDNGEAEFARMYEPGSNLPLACKILDKRDNEGYTRYLFYPVDKKTYISIRDNTPRFANEMLLQYQGRIFRYNPELIKNEFEKLKALDEKERKALCHDQLNLDYKKFFIPDEKEIGEILGYINDNGIWIEDVKLWNVSQNKMIEGKKTVKGFTISSFYRNMEMLLAFLQTDSK